MKCFLMLGQLGLVLFEASHCTEKYSGLIIIETYMVGSRVSSVVCLSVQITRKMQKPVLEIIIVMLNVG